MILFLHLFLRLLENGGRAAVIVPDSVLFGSSNAHVDIRKKIIEENRLDGIASMPSGVFRPYAGVSTAVLLFTKGGTTEKIWFYDMCPSAGNPVPRLHQGPSFRTVPLRGWLRKNVHHDTGVAYWALERNTPFYGCGRAGRLESTALALRVLTASGDADSADRELISHGLLFLLRNEDKDGMWYCGQTTVHVLKTLLSMVATRGRESGAKLSMRVNDKDFPAIDLPEGQMVVAPIEVDATEFVKTGSNQLALATSSEGMISVQFVADSYVAWRDDASTIAKSEPNTSSALKFTVTYSTTHATTDDKIECRVRAERIGYRGYGMMLGEVGLPPGADVDRESLERALKGENSVYRYDVLPDRVILYMWPSAGGSEFTFQFRPRFAMQAETAPSPALRLLQSRRLRDRAAITYRRIDKWVRIQHMRLQMRVRRIAGIYAMGLLIAHCVAAQTGMPSNTPPSNGEEIQLHSYLEHAAEAMHKGDNEAAAEALRRGLEIDPHSLAALNNLGIVLARMGKPAEAIPLYETALKFHPEDPSTKRNLAIAYFKAQRYAPAWRLLRPMAAKYPTDFQVLDLAGLSLFALDRYPEAASYLERANQVQPSDLETLDMLGKAYLRMKDRKALTSVFTRIMQVNPNSASAHIMMATAYEEADNRPEAIKEYQAAERADPNFAGVHSGLGRLYWQAGDFQLAESELREELRRFPNDPVSNCVLGQILLTNVQLEDAEAHFRLALKVNPAYVDALLGLGKTEIALKRPREAGPASDFPDLASAPLGRSSLFAILEHNYATKLAYADEEVDATTADAEISEMLGVPRGASVLRIRQIIYSVQGKATIYGIGFYRSERHSLLIRRFR